MTVTGRFAPSPSGPMHLGNARSALLAWLDARARGGRVVLRIEDLDRDRCRPEYAVAVRDDLRWLGLDWDAESTAQSRRDAVYEAALAGLRERGLVYECFCTRRDVAVASAPHGPGEEPRGCPRGCADLDPAERRRRVDAGERAALRVRLPEVLPAVDDRLHGLVVPSGDSGDMVVRRSDGLHAYHLAVVVDDAADGVTDVVRGDDLLASAPRQAALARLLDLPVPAYAHVPLLLGPDGARLAKRHGAISIAELRASGIGPDTLVTALAASAGLAADAGARPIDLVEGFALERIDRRPVTVRTDSSGLRFDAVNCG
ncbi:MAG: glutamyl-tRNA synthetase [Gaiellales bacterium]|nr:glutamyl-tRNA synthetase [Gaiellales bacterium]